MSTLLVALTAVLSLIASPSYAASADASTYHFRVSARGVKSVKVGPVWTPCAAEGSACQFSGTRPVRYGADGAYVTMAFAGLAACNNATFGDPAPNSFKSCSYDVTGTAPVAWTQCAGERSTCGFVGTRQVRYGAVGSYVTKTVTGSIDCTTAAFGTDPAPNVVKACYFSTNSQ